MNSTTVVSGRIKSNRTTVTLQHYHLVGYSMAITCVGLFWILSMLVVAVVTIVVRHIGQFIQRRLRCTHIVPSRQLSAFIMISFRTRFDVNKWFFILEELINMMR